MEILKTPTTTIKNEQFDNENELQFMKKCFADLKFMALDGGPGEGFGEKAWPAYVHGCEKDAQHGGVCSVLHPCWDRGGGCGCGGGAGGGGGGEVLAVLEERVQVHKRLLDSSTPLLRCGEGFDKERVLLALIFQRGLLRPSDEFGAFLRWCMWNLRRQVFSLGYSMMSAWSIRGARRCVRAAWMALPQLVV
eukprot:1848298-Amphidinium_carterae.1